MRLLISSSARSSEPVRRLSKPSLTCVLILRESHAVLHTWPETGTINIDIFSCTTRLQSVQAINELGQSFGARHLSIQEIARADGHGARRDTSS
jgi:S-adenosylmethionine decarboxylase